MSQRHQELKTLPRERFQIDQPDLDFGFYRITYESEEIELHRANADPHDIKPSECLRDCAFRLQPQGKANPCASISAW